MEKEDGRRLSPEAQHERRRQVIRAWKRGETKATIAENLGLSYSGVDKIIRRYQCQSAFKIFHLSASKSFHMI